MSRIDGAARPRTNASPAGVVATVTQRLTPSGGAPRSVAAGTEMVAAPKCRIVIDPAAVAVAGVNASTAPQNGDSTRVAP